MDTRKEKCYGCIKKINKIIKGDQVNNQRWLKSHRDPYPLLISFAIILCAGWGAVGVLGIISNNSGGYRLVIYLNVLVCDVFNTSLCDIFHYIWHIGG